MRSLPFSFESDFIKFCTKYEKKNFLKVEENSWRWNLGHEILFRQRKIFKSNQRYEPSRLNWRQAAVADIKFCFRIDAISGWFDKLKFFFNLSISFFLSSPCRTRSRKIMSDYFKWGNQEAGWTSLLIGSQFRLRSKKTFLFRSFELLIRFSV